MNFVMQRDLFFRHKFNFGLSERKVEKLLLLLRKRKIKDRLLERQFTRSNVARSVGYTAKEARSVIGDGSFVTIDNKKDERNVGATFGSAISTENFGDSTSKHRRKYDRDVTHRKEYGVQVFRSRR